MITNEKIAEALYEIITGNNGYRDDEHTKWEKEAKDYMQGITMDRNISLEGNKIEIQSSDGTKTLYKITVEKI